MALLNKSNMGIDEGDDPLDDVSMGTEISTCASDLECCGLGFLRSFDQDANEIHIVSPLSLSDLERVDTIVLWASSGRGEIPSQLLYRAAPEGDPYCFSSQSVLGGGGGGGGGSGGGGGGGGGLGVSSKGSGGGGGQGRTGLKRRRLDK
jgi:hypothetical protein